MSGNKSSLSTFLVLAATFIGLAWAGGAIQLPSLPGGDESHPLPDDCPSLVPAFSQNDNKAEAAKDAYVFGTICGSIASIIEQDGQQSEPRFTKGVQLDDLRVRIRQMRMGGQSFGTKYPMLRSVLEDYLNKKLGEDGGPIDKAQRDRWVAAFRSLELCSKHASQNL